MSGERERMRDIFDQARRLPASQRSAFLEGLPETDRAVRMQIEDMLAALDQAGGFMAAPTVSTPPARDTSATSVGPPREQPGTRIGPYKILQLIGEGGFGSVFLAEQEQPVRRRVALKIIKLGMDTRQVVARFEQERQALALMDHPGIAKVLDAGASEAGRPYFVMELVKGEPIIDYCDKHTLAIPARLELFSQVCQAVQHAHTKGIIHRDIKPNNILVSTQDGRPSAKVIDFGIAKATNARLTEKTLFTEHRQLIGTPEYMSPEQAEGSLDIDTRTDVYSLGVLLYELLTGSTPFDSDRLRSAAFGELQRIIREVDPPAPSTRLSQSVQTLESVAAHRRTEPRKLGTMIRGELDWIVMKALEKDRQRRYESAGGLAVDVQKYLLGEEVSAAPPSMSYRLRKFARRNRSAVAAVSAVAGALVLGMAAFAWQASVARGQRDRAVKAESEATSRASELELVANFQAGMLGQVDPTRAGIELTGDIAAKFRASLEKAAPPIAPEERDERAAAFQAEWSRVNATDVSREFIDRTILRPAAKSIETTFGEKPLVQAQLRQALASRYQELGLFEAALPLQRSALEARRRVLGEDDPLTLQSLSGLGVLHYLSGGLEEGERLVLEALEKQRRILGPDHADSIHTLNAVAALRLMQAKYEDCERLSREVLERQSRLAEPSVAHSITAAGTLASSLKSQQKLDEAEKVYRETLDRATRALGPEDDQVLRVQNDLATFLQLTGRLAEAEESFRQVLETSRRRLGADNVSTLITLGNLAFVLIEQGKLDEAEPLVVESFEGRRRVLGPDHPITLFSEFDLGQLREKQKKLVEAGDIYQDVAARRRRTLGLGHEQTRETLNALSNALLMQNKLGQATPVQRDLLEASRLSLGVDDPRTLSIMSVLGVILQHQDKAEAAEPVLRETLERRRRVLGPDHIDTLASMRNMGIVLGEQDKLVESEPYFREEIAARRRIQGPDHPETLTACSMLAYNLRKLRKYEELEAHSRDTLERLSRVVGRSNTESLVMVEMLGTSLIGLRKHDEAAAVLAEWEPSARAALTGPRGPQLGRHLALLGAARAGSGAGPANFSLAEASLLEADTLFAVVPGHPWGLECAASLATLYSAWNNAEPGKGYDAKATEWRAKAGLPE